MILYKFLGRERVALYTGYEWPVDEWVETGGPLDLCANGLHACNELNLPGWIDDELWLIELDGETETHDDVVVAQRARLVGRVDGWDEPAMRAFAESAIWRLRDLIVLGLELHARDGRDLARARDLGDVQEAAVTLARAGTRYADVLVLLADVVALARGLRPDQYESTREDDEADLPTAGAIAANMAFVAAHASGRCAVAASDDAASYEVGFAEERKRQSEWFHEQLGLDELAPI